MSFRTQVRDMAATAHVEACKALGAQCTYKDGNSAAVTLWCLPGPASKELAEILDCRAEEDARSFEIAIQTGFTADNVHVDNVITFEGHNYHVRRTSNPDTVEAVFELVGVCTHPNMVK